MGQDKFAASKGYAGRSMSAIRRLAAVLAVDVVGYSRLIEADEGATLSAIEQG